MNINDLTATSGFFSNTSATSRSSSPMFTALCSSSLSCNLLNRSTKLTNQNVNRNDMETLSNNLKTDHHSVKLGSVVAAPLTLPTPNINAEQNCIVKSIKNMMGLTNTNTKNFFIKLEPTKLIRDVNCDATPMSQFIDPVELRKRLFEISSNFLIILLDCRTYTDFNLKHIKDSVHLNCRDKLTKKRLQSRKLTVKDLISCEEIKSKFDSNEKLSSLGAACSEAKKLCPKISAPASLCSVSSEIIESDETKTDNNNIIVLYDDTTSDLTDLQCDSNPLKIVQENIKQCGYKNECKILKGGFKKFAEMCPEFCVLKEASQMNQRAREQHSEPDIRQSDIDNAVMTQIMPYLYLGNECDAKNMKKLEQNDIYYILNVTKNIPFYEIPSTNGNKKFILKRIAVNDNENQNLKEHFEEAIEFIDEARKNNQKVLVHCQAGISRSPTIVIAYLMKKLELRFNDAYNKVRGYRPIIAPNLIFMSQLMDYETKLDEISKTPSTASPNINSTDPPNSNNPNNFFVFNNPILNDKNNTILVCN